MAPSFSEALSLHQSGRLAEAENLYRTLLAAAPQDAQIATHLGVLRAQRGALEEGALLLAEVVRRAPREAMAWFHLGTVYAAMGKAAEAFAAFEGALAASPARPDFLFALGNAAFQLGRYDDAVAAYTRLDAETPGQVEVLLNWGSALQELGRPLEALAVCDRVLALAPDHAGALNDRGNALRVLNRPQEALAAFERALGVEPRYDLARFNRATVLETLRRYDDALRECDNVLQRGGSHGGAHALRGAILLGLSRPQEALDSFSRALALEPSLGRALHGRISALLALSRWEEALAESDKTIARAPDDAAAHNNRGTALMKLRRYDEAEIEFARALAIDPASAEGYFNRAGLHYARDRLDAACADTIRALECRPDFVSARAFRFGTAAHLCDWHEREAMQDTMLADCAAGEDIDPFLLTYAFDDPELHLAAATRIADRVQPAMARVAPAPRRSLRVAYLSGDLRDHPVTHQALELFEAHDRARIESFAIALWPMPQDGLGGRLRAAFSQVVEAYDRSDQEIARRLADLHIDIAVELGGYTDKARPGILAWRPAPIAASWLGYPGTLGTPFIDYIIADSVTIPPQDDRFYSEKVVRLATSMMPFDSRTAASGPPPSRVAEGLPEEGFVFCNFNKTDKLTPQIYDIWMRLLAAAPDSVFWLNVQNETAQRNLRAEAAVRGIDPARIVFAQRVEGREEHLARIALADLFLDTFPYNAHATTSDFLAAGVPVLTVKGRTFASRVAASLLTQVGAEGLIARGLDVYERMALDFAMNPGTLQPWRQHLLTHKRTAADTVRLARGLEAAYFHMWERRMKGLKPESFTLAP